MRVLQRINNQKTNLNNQPVVYPPTAIHCRVAVMDAADEQLQNSSSVLSDAGSIIEEVEVSDAVHSFEPFEREKSNELTWDHRGESDVTVRGISVLSWPSIVQWHLHATWRVCSL